MPKGRGDDYLWLGGIGDHYCATDGCEQKAVWAYCLKCFELAQRRDSVRHKREAWLTEWGQRLRTYNREFRGV